MLVNYMGIVVVFEGSFEVLLQKRICVQLRVGWQRS
jgi:hypothetical protein